MRGASGEQESSRRRRALRPCPRPAWGSRVTCPALKGGSPGEPSHQPLLGLVNVAEGKGTPLPGQRTGNGAARPRETRRHKGEAGRLAGAGPTAYGAVSPLICVRAGLLPPALPDPADEMGVEMKLDVGVGGSVSADGVGWSCQAAIPPQPSRPWHCPPLALPAGTGATPPPWQRPLPRLPTGYRFPGFGGGAEIGLPFAECFWCARLKAKCLK